MTNTIANPGQHLVLPSVATHYVPGLLLGLGRAPGGYNTCYPDCQVCHDESELVSHSLRTSESEFIDADYVPELRLVLGIRDDNVHCHHPCPVCQQDTKDDEAVDVYVRGDRGGGSVCYSCQKRYVPHLLSRLEQERATYRAMWQ